MDSYKKSYVAFLDILGFKEMINTSAFDKIFNIFQLNICSDEYKKAFSKAFNENDDNCEDLKAYNEALQNAMIYTMSDSLVISTDSEKPMALEVIIDACLYVQTMLYTFDTPILLRGAIAVGDYYCNNSIAFGKGMVDAYICQENYSIYPRIILSTDIVKKLSDSSYKEDKLCLDDDGYYYIDCVKEYLDGKSESSEECVKFQKIIRKYLDGYYDTKLREKYRWLSDEYDRVVYKIQYGRIGIGEI